LVIKIKKMLKQNIPLIIAEGMILKEELEQQGAKELTAHSDLGVALTAKQMDLVCEYKEVIKTLKQLKKEI
jgi:hypothetical protein